MKLKLNKLTLNLY